MSPRSPSRRAQLRLAAFIFGLLPALPVLADAPPVPQAPAKTPVVKPQPSAASFLAWRASMYKLALPRAGCFKASYPTSAWTPVACTEAPARPLGPAGGAKPKTTGNGSDFAAQTTGFISTASGSFPSVSGIVSESDSKSGDSSAFSLQLNANTFTTAACNGAATPSTCRGWQQFAVINGSSRAYVFMQYWLLGYGTCPAGWNSYGSSHCWRNSASTAADGQSISDLAQLGVTGTANADGTDSVIFSSAGGDLSAVGQDSVLDLAQNWQTAEFNVFGAADGSQAIFNPGTTLVVSTKLDDGTNSVPVCTSQGFTGETNSLNLLAPCCPIGGDSPGILFTESSGSTATSMCACAIDARWNPDTSTCECEPGTTVVNGACQNRCGGTRALAHAVGAACGTSCGHWACNGANAVSCQSFTNACGGCSTLPQIPGAGPQPGQNCTCSNGARGLLYCTAAKTLSCDCLP